jgi:hypothetical protein
LCEDNHKLLKLNDLCERNGTKQDDMNQSPEQETQPQMPLADLISRIATNVQGSNVPKLETRLALAIVDRDTKKAALDALLLDDQDGSQLMKAEDALSGAERRVLNLRSALAAAQTKQVTAQTEADEEAKRAERQKAIALAEDRHKAIERLAKTAAVFAAEYNAVLRINSDLLAHLPNHDSMAALTDRYGLETALRKELVRLDLPWCFSWPYGKVSLPDLLPQFEGALGVIRNLLSKDR